MIEIVKGIYLNTKGIVFQTSKSSGPGGQHVNKVNSRVTLCCPLAEILGLSIEQLKTITEMLSAYIVENEIRISSQKHRSQYSNKVEATAKLEKLFKKSFKPKKITD